MEARRYQGVPVDMRVGLAGLTWWPLGLRLGVVSFGVI
jgi:hypothetical protein